jgi:hypothetical protein
MKHYGFDGSDHFRYARIFNDLASSNTRSNRSSTESTTKVL